jgi:hypothetical protein
MPVRQPKPTRLNRRSAARYFARGPALACRARPRRARDGEFVFAVSSTGVYCRPSCAARRPRRENVQFFAGPEQAERAGYRACLRCRPKSFSGDTESDSVKAICRFIEQHLDEPLTLERLGKEFHQSPFHLAAPFQGGARHHAARLCRFLPPAHAETQSAGRGFGHPCHVRRGIRFQQPALREDRVATGHDARQISPRRDCRPRFAIPAPIRRWDAC